MEKILQILVATHNAGKLREYAELLKDALPQAVEWVLLSDLGIDTDVDETGDSFEANARLKAAAYAQMSGLYTLADDSGLEVDALNGEPGIYSARYGGPELDDQGRYRLLLQKLDGVPDEKRTARFRCVVALCAPSGELYTADGACEGRIGYEPRGEHGFGYDPVFEVDGYDQTMAELLPEIKNRISHRARALEAFKPALARVISARLYRCSDNVLE